MSPTVDRVVMVLTGLVLTVWALSIFIPAFW